MRICAARGYRCPLLYPPHTCVVGTRTYTRTRETRECACDRGASPLRKRRAVGQPAGCQSTQVHRSRRAVIFLRYVQSVRDRTCCSRARDAVRHRQRRAERARSKGGRARRSTGRPREEKRRDEKGREGKEAGKKGKATRTGHARLSTRHLRVARADHESRVRERERERNSIYRGGDFHGAIRRRRAAILVDVRRHATAGPPGSLDRATARIPGDPAARATSPGLPNLYSKFCQSTPRRTVRGGRGGGDGGERRRGAC